MVADMDSSAYEELLPRSANDKGHGCSGTDLPCTTVVSAGDYKY